MEKTDWHVLWWQPAIDRHGDNYTVRIFTVIIVIEYVGHGRNHKGDQMYLRRAIMGSDNVV